MRIVFALLAVSGTAADWNLEKATAYLDADMLARLRLPPVLDPSRSPVSSGGG